MVPVGAYLGLSAILFAMVSSASAGATYPHLVSLEIMLNAVNVNFAAVTTCSRSDSALFVIAVWPRKRRSALDVITLTRGRPGMSIEHLTG
jgi:NADH:ubiquinone oxidoreductase subunit K